MDLISNIGGSHFDLLKNIFSDSDRVIIVSPFLSESFDVSPLQGATIKEIVLYTTLKSNSLESIDKILALNNFVEFCKMNRIKYSVRIDNNLHAKIYVAYKGGVAKKAILSSANFTNKGLKINHELGIVTDGEEFLPKILKEIDNLPFDNLSEDALEEIFKKLDDYMNIKKAAEIPQVDLDFSSLFNKSKHEFNREIVERKYFIKPVGNHENPFPITSTYSNKIEKLYFSKRYPRAVTQGSVMICYAVGDRRVIGYYKVISGVLNDLSNSRYPYYVEAENLNLQYSKDWALNNFYITQMAQNYLSLGIDNYLIFNGNRTLGALNFGSDKIRLNALFAEYVITEIEKHSNSTYVNFNCTLNKHQKLIARELINAAKHKGLVCYKELFALCNGYYDHNSIGRALGEISNLCVELNFPLLSSLAVSEKTLMPSWGFNNAFNKEKITEEEFCVREINRAYEFQKWDEFLKYIN